MDGTTTHAPGGPGSRRLSYPASSQMGPASPSTSGALGVPAVTGVIETHPAPGSSSCHCDGPIEPRTSANTKDTPDAVRGHWLERSHPDREALLQSL